MGKSRERFVRLAETRVPKAIKSLRLIGNLSNKSNYSYSKEDVDKIMRVLENELRLLKKKFDTSDQTNDISFKL